MKLPRIFSKRNANTGLYCKGIFQAGFLFFISIHQNSQAQIKPFTKTFPYDSVSVPRSHNVDFQHLRLEVSFDLPAGKVIGKVTHVFTPLLPSVDTVFLDAPGIDVSEISFHGKSLPFKEQEEGITLLFSEPLVWDKQDSITINYTAHPRKGLYFVGWNDPTNRCRKQVWSQGQGIDNRAWIPMYDEMNDKITSELIVTMPKPYKVLSNGIQLNVTDKGKDQVWHYRMNKPHAPYLIMLGIGEYEIETRTTARGLKEHLWYYPDWKDRVESTYQYSTEMIDFFENEIGVNFPWEQYSQIPVQDFMFGAMENTTATVFGDFFMNDARGTLDRNYVAVNAHELAHQWFGDMVTARTPTHHWLQESFATHYNMTYERQVFGQDHFDQGRRGAQEASIAASLKDLYPIASSKAGSTRHYPKGAVVLEMLKYVVGREAFNKSIKHYLLDHAYGNVDTEDLLIAFHETLGLSLDWFWEEWLYKGGEPSYLVSTGETKTSVTFMVNQTQENGAYTSYFKMPIVFEVNFTDGTSASKKVWVEGRETMVIIDIPEGKTVAYALFDPGNQIIKSVQFSKTFDQLKQQAVKAKYMLDRLDAIQAMVDLPLAQKREFLIQYYGKENWYSIKESIINQLAKDADKKSRSLLKSAINDKDLKVRKALIAAFDTIPADLMKDVEKLLSEASYALQESVLRKLCLSNPTKISDYLDRTKNEMGDNSRNIRLLWLKLAYKNGKQEVLSELIDFTSSSFEFNTRRNAIGVIKELEVFNEAILKNALDIAYSPNFKLSSAGIGYLNWASGTNPTWRKLIYASAGENHSKWQQEVWKKIMKD